VVGEGALEDPKQRRGRNGLFEVHLLIPFGEEGRVLEEVCRGGQFLKQRGLPHQKVFCRDIPMNCGNMCQNHGNVKEKVPVHGITQGHQISRQDAGNDGRFQASLHENQGLVRGKVPCEGLALKRGVPCDGGGRGGQRRLRYDVSRHDVAGKRIVLRLCLYEEQAAGDEKRGELGGSNLEESCLPGKVVCPRIIEEIRDNLEGGRDVSG
jgi:hypothetical protein